MKNIEEFVDFNIKITKQDNGKFGYFPFHAFVEKKDGTFDVIVIAGVNSVEDCYKLMVKYISDSCKRIYMAIDFPAGGDIPNDFVAVFATEGIDFKAFAIPYDVNTGKVYERLLRSRQMIEIVSHLKSVSLKIMFNNHVSQN